MKDQVVIVAEALWHAKNELQEYYDNGARDTDRTLDRLHDILFDPGVSEAMGIITPGLDAPLVPEQKAFPFLEPAESSLDQGQT